MIGRKQTTEKPVVHGKERQMLVIKVMFWRIGDDMVYVMCAFSPTKRKTPNRGSDDHTNQAVNRQVM